MNICSISNLSYAYVEGDEKALKNVSLEIEGGQYVALLGHNGSGKSTLAKCMMGLITNFEGEISIFGLRMERRNLHDIRSRVGIVFQNPDNQFVGSTVADDIAFGLENKRVKREDMQPIIDEFARKTGMDEYLGQEPQSLSGRSSAWPSPGSWPLLRTSSSSTRRPRCSIPRGRKTSSTSFSP